ncbi:MAG TPA: TIGR00730 family Rossman fold protein [Jatrophihabitans sp.]|uniref:LOG family protein n=1 Tax=Jatrophihabitans sp. TaxID=1932789 RepID=UPI002EF0C18C
MSAIHAKRNSIGVFCGSRAGTRPQYVKAAQDLGATMARRGANLVYGAGGSGIMGMVASAARDNGALVTGVIPHQLLEQERRDKAVGQIFVVNSMHARKLLMYQLSGAFVILPGGFGTFDELMEVVTWNQLGFHSKPVVVVNVEGFFDPLLTMLDRMRDEGFAADNHRDIVQAASSPAAALDALAVQPANRPAQVAEQRLAG